MFRILPKFASSSVLSEKEFQEEEQIRAKLRMPSLVGPGLGFYLDYLHLQQAEREKE
jgi:hypothetical protein